MCSSSSAPRAELANSLAPLPYKSKYPFAPKLLDAAITMAIDPIVKPASLRGKLDKMPVLKKLAGELADTGFFRKYPGGGIGIGGGGGSEGEGGAPGEGGGPGETGAGFGPGEPGGGGPGIGEGPAGPAGDPGEDATASSVGLGTHGGDPGLGSSSAAFGGGSPAAGELGPEGLPSEPTSANLSAAARASSPTFGNAVSGLLGALGFGPNASASNLSAAVSTALSALGLLGATSMPGAGLAAGTAVGTAMAQANAFAGQHGISLDAAMAALSEMAQAVSASDAASGLSSGQSGGAEQGPGEMMPTAPADIPFTAPPTTRRPAISPASRANAAARLGGGISESFLEALEQIRQRA